MYVRKIQWKMHIVYKSLINSNTKECIIKIYHRRSVLIKNQEKYIIKIVEINKTQN